jgi:probable DNA metabolism protein
LFVTYDGTFDGLLSAAAFCLRNRILPQAVFGADGAADGQPNGERLIVDCLDIPSEANIRRLFQRHLGQVLGPAEGAAVLDIVFHAYLSELPGMADAICAYLRRTLELRQNPSARLHEAPVAAVVQAAAKVSRQAHKYLGLLRFREISPGMLQADFEPDHHILPLILPHFCDRMSGCDFVIRDLRRHVAAFHSAHGAVRVHYLAGPETPAAIDQPASGGGAILAQIAAASEGAGLEMAEGAECAEGAEALAEWGHDRADAAAPDSSDAEFAALWQRYLRHLTIPERRNLALQQQFIPKKYWKYLVEQPGGADHLDLCRR